MEIKGKDMDVKMEAMRKDALDLLQFIEESPSVYHVIDNMKKRLEAAGLEELDERQAWKPAEGKGYFVIRNGSSLIAFKMPKKAPKGFHLVASHSDSPTFKLKEKPEMMVEDKYVKLNTEKYGGGILNTWLDRPLSVAGRVVVKDDAGNVTVKLVNIDKDLLVIPNLSIHMNRDVNKGIELNPQVDMLPLMSLSNAKDGKDSLMKAVAEAAGVSREEILGQDLYLYIREAGRLTGMEQEFILSPKLDDLQSVYASMAAFCNVDPAEYISVLAVFDNEEVGSGTMQGANSTLLEDVLKRIGESLGLSNGEYLQLVADSFLISADNAHAVHPNHPEKVDPTNRNYIGGGLVIKYHGSQKYTTDAVSGARMKLYCQKAEVPFQTFFNRSDLVGGSTLGNISTSHVSLSSVDVGLPQLAMHSAVEMAGTADTTYARKAFEAFYAE